MRTAAHYRSQAAQAERTARTMSRADHRDELLQLARTWRALAAEMEPAAAPQPLPPQVAAGETELG